MDVFAALADPVRRDLLLRLARGPTRVGELAAGHPISRPAVSRHLRVLRDAGLVTVAAHGRERPHVLERDALRPVQTLVDDLMRETPAPPFGERLLDGLDLEVRRTVRDQPQPAAPREGDHEETA